MDGTEVDAKMHEVAANNENGDASEAETILKGDATKPDGADGQSVGDDGDAPTSPREEGNPDGSLEADM